MNIYDYTNMNKLINERLKKANEKKIELNKKAYKEKIFEVEIGELLKEIERILSQKYSLISLNVYFEDYEISSIVANENISLYAEKHKPEFVIHLFDRNISTGGIFSERINVQLDNTTKTSDGRYLFDNIKIKAGSTSYFCGKKLHIPEDMQEKLIVNLDPSAKYFENTILKQAAINCAKRREKQQKIEKTPEK